MKTLIIYLGLFWFIPGTYAQLICAMPGRDGDQTISGTVNSYYPGLTTNLNPNATSVSLGAAQGASAAIQTGDLLLVIQMQGANISASDNANYGGNSGNGGGYNGWGPAFQAGQFEYVQATSDLPATGGTLQFSPGLSKKYVRRNYSAAGGQSRYQVIKVPQYNTATLGGDLTAYPWDGEAGGVIALDVLANFYFNNHAINASASGFRGGGGRVLGGDNKGSNAAYRSNAAKNFNGQKGEGIAGTPAYVWKGKPGTANVISTGSEGYPNGSSGRGAPGNAGGGATDGNPDGNDQNAGGGGGGNGGTGGQGGNSWYSDLPTGGLGGSPFAQADISRMVLGGGGGAGSGNDSHSNPDALSGGTGGGMVFLKTRMVSGSGSILADGQNAPNNNPDCCDDGAGGGGAGGSVLFTALKTSGMSQVTISARGGKGGNTSANATAHGPGGGGGGGIIYTNAPIQPASTVAGGLHGTTTGAAAYSSTSGTDGVFSYDPANDPTSAYAGYKCAIPLAARRFDLNGNLQQNQVQLRWTTLQENHSDYFTIERSSDNRQFLAIIEKLQASGTTTGEKNYAYTDHPAATETSSILYYRIKLVDKEGQFSYSNTIAIHRSTISELRPWPNPFTDAFSFNFRSPVSAPIISELRSTSGLLIVRQTNQLVQGENQLRITGLAKLPKGMYFLTVLTADGQLLKPIRVVKE